MVQAAASIIGRESPAAPSAVDYLMRPHVYSIDKARRRLGFKPAIAFGEGMGRVRRWLDQKYGG